MHAFSHGYGTLSVPVAKFRRASTVLVGAVRLDRDFLPVAAPKCRLRGQPRAKTDSVRSWRSCARRSAARR